LAKASATLGSATIAPGRNQQTHTLLFLYRSGVIVALPSVALALTFYSLSL
jgi:hypothetical protein